MKKNLYFLAILPPKDISLRIHNFKREVDSMYGARHALKSPPHITLVPPFWMHENSENSMLNSMQALSAEMPNFDIELNDFDTFEPNVLFVKVNALSSLISCHSSAKNVAESFLEQPIKMNHPFHPHVTVAFKDLNLSNLEPALTHFKDKQFSTSFQFQKIELLKYNGQAWVVVSSDV